VSGILKLIGEQMEIEREMIVPAAVTILIVVYKFLVDIQKVDGSPQKIGELIGKTVATIGNEYGFKPEELEQMIQPMPSEGGMKKAANTQRAMQGPLGAMMKKGGI
jgi:hypothetical protein